MIGWCHKTFQFSFRLNKFIFGSFRSRMRAPHPSRKKSAGKKSKAGQDLFRSRDVVTSGEKGPTRADIAQLRVAHVQNILPNRTSSGHFRSRHFLSLLVTSGQACAIVRSSGSSANVAWTVPIYYCHKSKDRQTKKNKMINSGLQKTTQKTEDWAARIPLKTRTDPPVWLYKIF
jgi:hypothetical protein